jgi:hypothetical protein
MNAALKNAQDSLKILDVTLRRSNIELNDDYENFDLETVESKIQMFREVSKVYSLTNSELSHSPKAPKPEGEEQTETPSFYIFRYSVGIRAVSTSEVDTESEPTVYLEMTAEFDARYKTSSYLSDDEINSFCKDNVGINVWPFWRELVQSSCGKLGLQKIIPIPFYRIIPKQQES